MGYTKKIDAVEIRCYKIIFKRKGQITLKKIEMLKRMQVKLNVGLHPDMHRSKIEFVRFVEMFALRCFSGP